MSSNVIKRADPTDDYELLQRVGSGTYGEVYKARHIRSGELSAVKVVKLEAGDNFAVIQQEIMMIRDCVHSNIIAYYGSYLRRDRLWIVMEYCGGGSLQDIYHMTGPLSELQIAFVCRETLKGLDYLHKMGKVHRDIKGANILLTHHGDVKLADFGVAAQISSTIGKRKSFIGTPYWMAPEVACVERRGGYGVQCDIWAVGITAIELAECQPPFFDLHPMQVLYLMTKSGYKPPGLKDKHRWSPMFHDFVKQCLTKNPKKRPAPDKLLASHHFVLGSLSSRMTRDLLDKVNNGGASASLHRLSKNMEEQDEEFDDEEDQIARRPCGSPTFRLAEKLEGKRIGRPSERPPEPPNPSRRILPDREVPPLPDVVGGSQLLHDKDGVILEEDDLATLRPGTGLMRLANPHGRSASEERNKVSYRNNDDSKPRPATHFGLPSTPKVSMGACFAQMLHDVSLKVNCSALWHHPMTNDAYLILGCDEGIYGFDLTRLHDAHLVKLHHRKCSWLFVHKDVLMTVQGRTSYLYRHDIVSLTAKNFTLKISKKMTKVPERFLPKMLAISVRLPETKNCFQCCTREGEGHLFLAVALPASILLFQWYDPQNRFLALRSCDLWSLTRFPLKPFQLVSTRTDFPQVCIGIKRRGDEHYVLEYAKFDETNRMVNPDTTLEAEDTDTRLDVIGMNQIDRNTVIFAFGNQVIITDLSGNSRSFVPNGPSTFSFNFRIESLVVLPDSILVFHAHGVEGRSLLTAEKTQELYDQSKIYKVIGNDSMLVLKTRPLNSCEYYDLCFLTGHADTPGFNAFVL